MRFAGYAAVFGRPDDGGDVVRPGAFARAVAKGADAVPLLREHRGGPIGRVELLAEDAHGLRVVARLTDGGRVAAGAGLSFGFHARAARLGTYRELIDLDLVEVSLVARPMQAAARVAAVSGNLTTTGDTA